MEKKLVEEGMKKYLKIQGNGDETMSDRMFSYQNIPGFLPVENISAKTVLPILPLMVPF